MEGNIFRSGEPEKNNIPLETFIARVNKAPPNKPEIQGKIVKGWKDVCYVIQGGFRIKRYIFRLQEHYDCVEPESRNCDVCGLCPWWEDVSEVATRETLEAQIKNLAENFNGSAGLLHFLFNLGFSLKYRVSFHIPLKGTGPFFKALYLGRKITEWQITDGKITKDGISLEISEREAGREGIIKLLGKDKKGLIFTKELGLFDKEPAIRGISMPYNLAQKLNKQVLIGLIREWHRLSHPAAWARF